MNVVSPEFDEPGGDVFDRIEPWERSVGAPAEAIDLGWLALCVHADPLEPTTEFYARLGFRFVPSPGNRRGPFPSGAQPVALGRLVLCFDVKDLEKSSQFYQRLGMQLAETTEDSATFTAIPPHATAAQLETAYLLRLRQAKESGQGLAFICEDPEAVSAAIRKRDIPMLETQFGPAFIDPQGRRVALIPG